MIQTNHTPESFGKEKTDKITNRAFDLFLRCSGDMSKCQARDLAIKLASEFAQQQTDKLYTREQVVKFLKSIIDDLPLYGNDSEGYWINKSSHILGSEKTPEEYVDEWFNQNYPK